MDGDALYTIGELARRTGFRQGARVLRQSVHKTATGSAVDVALGERDPSSDGWSTIVDRCRRSSTPSRRCAAPPAACAQNRARTRIGNSRHPPLNYTAFSDRRRMCSYGGRTTAEGNSAGTSNLRSSSRTRPLPSSRSFCPTDVTGSSPAGRRSFRQPTLHGLRSRAAADPLVLHEHRPPAPASANHVTSATDSSAGMP